MSSGATYDANGDVLTDSLHSYAWDVETRPTTIDTVTATYDALGRMVEQTKAGASTEIQYSPAGYRMQLMNGQSTTDAFVALPGGATMVFPAGGPVYYRHPDWLGSTRFASTSSTRTMYNDLAYAPFGEQYAPSGTTGVTNTSFAGNNQDTTTNLYDAQFREYEIYGRWPSPDPAGTAAANPANPQSWNRYAYVMNNPLIATDPSGLGPYMPSAPQPNDPMGDYPGCYMDGIPIGCGQAEMEVGMGAAMVCPDSSCGGVGSPFECDAIGICGYGTIDDNPAPPNLTKEQIAACEQAILNAVNNTFGADFTLADVGTGPDAPFQWPQVAGGTVNIDVIVPAQDQPDGVSPGRYPQSVWTKIFGIGSTLHIPAGPGGLDSSQTLVFSNSQFTAHLDSAWPSNPIGAVFHLFKDVLGIGGHSPCP